MQILKYTQNLTKCRLNFNKITSQFKMSTILTAYSLCILCFSFVTLLISQQIQLSYTTNKSCKMSSILFVYQSAITLQSFETLNVLEKAYYLISSKMSKLVYLQYWASKQNYTIENQVFLCNQSHPFNISILSQSLCISLFSQIDEKAFQSNQFIKFLNLHNQIKLIFDFSVVTEQMYFISFTDHFLTGYFPSKRYNEKTEAIQEQWFINYTTELKATQKYIPYKISKLFQKDNFNYLLASFSMAFLNKNFQISGIGSLLINFPGFLNLISMPQLSLMLLQEDGILVYSKSYLNHPMQSDLIQIYNESLTGFNKTDWDDMVQSQNYFDPPLYKYNSLLKQHMYIKAIKMLNTPLIQIILSNNTYESEMTQFLQSEFTKISSWFTNISLYAIFCDIFIIILGILPLKLIFRQSNVVLDLMIKYLKGQFDYKLSNEILGQNHVIKSSNNCLNNLFEAYEKIDKIINNSQFIKSEQCQIIESFRFQKNEKIKLQYSTDIFKNASKEIDYKEFLNLIQHGNH